MLSCESNRPKIFSEVNHHHFLVQILKKYTAENIPHLIFYGSSGHSKKTLTYCLLNNLALNTTFSLKISTIKQPKAIEISYLESPDIIEISPCDYQYNDKHVIMSLIKELAQTKPITAMFKKQNKKFIVLNEADKMTKDAQAALRRTVEKYSDNVRIIMLCEEINSIIQPIRSRFTCIRVEGFTDTEIKGLIPTGVSDYILKSSNGNLRKALCMVDLQEKDDDSLKRIKRDNKITFEYERIIDGIIKCILTRQDGQGLLEVRKQLYELLNGCVPARVILKNIVRKLIERCKGNDAMKICEYGLLYDERIKLGTKDILHLEGFVASSMGLFIK